MKKICFALLACCCIAIECYAGGPWTPWKHKGIFIASVSPIIYSSFSSDTGRISLHRRVADVSIQFYTEYGITDELAIVLNVPMKYVQTGKSIQSGGDFTNILPSGRMLFFGNTELEMKYKFYQNKIFLVTGAFKVETPVAKYKDRTGLRTGCDTWGIIPTVHMGMGFPKNVYVQWMGAFAFRTNNYSDEWRVNLEAGYTFKKPFTLALLLQARQSLENGSRNDANPELSNNLQTGLYLNDEQYYAWTIKMSYKLNSRLGINWSLGGGIKTRYIARTPAFSFGVFYDWQQEKPERRK